jgi:hypothetical protein
MSESPIDPETEIDVTAQAEGLHVELSTEDVHAGAWLSLAQADRLVAELDAAIEEHREMIEG